MNIKAVPVPMFQLDKHFNILSSSKAAEQVFLPASNFLTLVDDESKNKVTNFLVDPLKQQDSIEVNLQTYDNPFSLFQLFIEWENEIGSLICIEKDDEYQRSTQILHRLREQLQSIDFHEYEAHIRKELLPAILNVKLSDLHRLSLSEYSGSLKDVPSKIDTTLDLISVLRPELIEIGKSEYLDLITNELTDISSIIHYLLAASTNE
ncbi:hypothetical protein JCM9140_2385 [Halalkalibacter wakoensis JCM 9140]|uniref:Uncharacterized protein n=1 Tax=Halalkalibacter wakoensis JCM 9140 TaxID=1236970 RepID=W4Q4P3_9BACI|nr:hypothetical protein [Halalkalibacter wakoensis]GAE26334.1 hypothetical protein JCM9140_2385 [Halalkalibacter wakoensis JCM 9140]